MIVSLHDGFMKPLVAKATRLLCTYEDGTPFALITEVVPGHVRVFRAGDNEFNERLRQSGISETVIVDKLEPKTLEAKPLI